MQEQPIPTIIEQQAVSDGTVLGMLMSESSHRPWAFHEIAREMGVDPRDNLDRLSGGGLIHRMGGFAWASRAAVMADELDM